MYKENLNAKMEKLEAQIRRCTRQGLQVMPWMGAGGDGLKLWESTLFSG